MRSSYSEEAIQALIESYAETSELKDTTPRGLLALVKIADLDRALRQLKADYRRVILLHGIYGLPTRATAEILQKSHAWVGKQYGYAIEELHYLMNGGE